MNSRLNVINGISRELSGLIWGFADGKSGGTAFSNGQKEPPASRFTGNAQPGFFCRFSLNGALSVPADQGHRPVSALGTGRSPGCYLPRLFSFSPVRASVKAFPRQAEKILFHVKIESAGTITVRVKDPADPRHDSCRTVYGKL